MTLRERIEREMMDRPRNAPKPEAVEVRREELLQMRLDKDAYDAGVMQAPVRRDGDETLMGVPLRVVAAPGTQRIVPAVIWAYGDPPVDQP